MERKNTYIFSLFLFLFRTKNPARFRHGKKKNVIKVQTFLGGGSFTFQEGHFIDAQNFSATQRGQICEHVTVTQTKLHLRCTIEYWPGV